MAPRRGDERSEESTESGRRSRPKGENRLKPVRIDRTIDTRIFRPLSVSFCCYVSTSYQGVRCLRFITVHNDAQLIHANFTHFVSR